jgi:CubicO group peptidase (beta-lactamase class C family)
MGNVCQKEQDAVDVAQAKYDGLKNSPKKQGVQAALTDLLAKQKILKACIKTNTPFTITGDTPKPGTALTQFDKAMEDFFRANEVRAGQLTILKGGVKKFEHAYTLSYPPYPITQVDSLFRIASISKAFTCGAIQVLLDGKKLKLNETVFQLLEITNAALGSQNPDPRINNITVKNLVDHLGGFNDQGVGMYWEVKPSSSTSGKIPVPTHFDPVWAIRKIATDMNLTGPPTKMDVARYMYGEPLQFTPGGPIVDKKGKTAFAYSNFGYVLLGLVVEKKSGMPFVDFVRQQVLAPIGITDLYLARMLSGPIPREVSYDDPSSGANALEPRANVIASSPWGGFGGVTDLMDSGGGLVSNATAIAQYVNKFMAFGLGHGRGNDRSGEMPGTAAWADSTIGDVDFSFTLNTSTFPAKAVFLASQLETLVASL